MERHGEYNNHHVWSPKCEFKTPVERRVRNLGGFVVRGLITDHKELHANVDHPPKPTPEQLHDLYNFMQEHAYKIDGLEGLEWGICWANDRKLYELEDNLEQQHLYISGDYRK